MAIINDNTPQNTAAKNIAAVIDAMSEAQKSQIDLKKAVIMKQIGDKMDLAQQAKQQIQTKNINYGYTPGGDNSNIAQTGMSVPPATPMGSVLNPAAGTADSGTPSALGAPAVGNTTGSPMSGVLNPAAPPQPQPTPNATLRTPTPTTGGQPIVPPGRTQAPTNPVLNGPTAPSAGIGGQPILPASIQYKNLGYKPVEAQQLLAARRANGETINAADTHYVKALQKVKSGAATAGEVAMVNKMNGRDEQGNLVGGDKPINVGKDPNPSLVQSDPALAMLEQRYGYPPGSLTRDFETGNPVINPFVKSQIEARQRAQEIQEVNKPMVEEGRQNTLENEAINRISNVRGDTSIKNIETQRDSTILAYKTLQDCKNQNRLPTQFEYADILGQIWKARTGAAPTNDVMAELNTPNMEQNLRKLNTWLTGNASPGTSTPSIVNSLTNFVKKLACNLIRCTTNIWTIT